jgi:hypothetical protein
MMKIFYRLFTIFFILFTIACASPQKTDEDSNSIKANIDLKPEDILPPPVAGESIYNEKGELVLNSKYEPKFFQEPSKDNLEYFRVILSANQYYVRQIRGSKFILRNPDDGGDALSKDEIHGFDLVELTDDGILSIQLNSNTGNMEVINFDRRVPRINDVAKVIQNDLSRWNFKHESKDEKPIITKMKVYYQIILHKTLTREEIKAKYFKKKK